MACRVLGLKGLGFSRGFKVQGFKLGLRVMDLGCRFGISGLNPKH